jgi:hypothetical protein
VLTTPVSTESSNNTTDTGFAYQEHGAAAMRKNSGQKRSPAMHLTARCALWPDSAALRPIRYPVSLYPPRLFGLFDFCNGEPDDSFGLGSKGPRAQTNLPHNG